MSNAQKSFPSIEEYRIGSVKSIITFPPLLQLNYILNVEISRWKAVRECEVSHVQMILLVHFPFLLLFLSSKGFVSGQSESNVDHPEIFMIETEETKQESVGAKEEGGSDHSTDQVTTLKKWIILIILYKTPFVSCCKHETKDSFMHCIGRFQVVDFTGGDNQQGFKGADYQGVTGTDYHHQSKGKRMKCCCKKEGGV